jgi:superfamily II DNA or RNA helicase
MDKIDDGKDININFKYDLRDNQKPVVEKYLEVAKDIGGGIISVPCGFGKTVIALYLLAALGKKAIVIVHKEFLMDQWKERIEYFLPGAKIGKLQGKIIKTEGYDIVLGMLQSISMRDYEDDIFNDFGMVIYDECHHLGAEVFSRSLMKVNCKYTLGLSATPTRADGLSKVFEWFLGDIVYLIKKREQEDVKVKMIEYYNEDEKYSDIKFNFKGQVNSPAMINNITAFEPRNLILIEEIKICIKEKRKILILSDRRNHLKYLKEKLDELNFCTSGYYLGGMKQKELKETETKDVMLGTFSMASEGFDCKELNTIMFASPKSNIEQAVGRILRMKKEDRKVIPMVIDFVDKFSLFGRQAEKRKKFYEKNKYDIEIISK